MSTNFFVKSPKEESYREGCDNEDGVPIRVVDPGLGCKGLAVEEVEASARGDAERTELPSSGDRGGVGSKRCEYRFTGDVEYDSGDIDGEATEDSVISAGEVIFEVRC